MKKSTATTLVVLAGGLLTVFSGALPTSAGVAAAGPYCFDTGPGYQKCVDDDYTNPIYQGPKVYQPNYGAGGGYGGSYGGWTGNPITAAITVQDTL